MLEKIKIPNIELSDKTNEIIQQLGLVLMTAAITMSTVELGHRPETRVALPNQPSMVPAVEHVGHEGSNSIRREREEVRGHHVSYSNYQRTPARSGRV